MKNLLISAAIGGALACIGAGFSAHYVQTKHNDEMAAMQALLTAETQFHETNVVQCERAAGFAIKAVAVYDYNKSGLEAIKRVYELTASEPIAVRQGAARVTSMIEMYHRMTGNNEPNRLILEQFDKELKLACQKRPLK